MYRYKIYKSDNKVIAVGSFAGKAVRGIAKCDPEDLFYTKIGEDLATARCENKIATKRVKHAELKKAEALKAFNEAKKFLDEMSAYYDKSVEQLAESQENLNRALDEVLSKTR